MTRLLTATLTALTLMTGSPAFANSHCTCDEKCAHECQQGKTDNCTCKDCGCSKGEGCKHGKCTHPRQPTK
jgi:hypothetical protein